MSQPTATLPRKRNVPPSRYARPILAVTRASPERAVRKPRTARVCGTVSGGTCAHACQPYLLGDISQAAFPPVSW